MPDVTVAVDFIRPSDCCDDEGALDCDVDVTVDGAEYSGELTLCRIPSQLDHYGCWGAGPDHWVSSELLIALRIRYADELREVLDTVAAEAGAACDAWAIENAEPRRGGSGR
jgi:hypothetical protein